MIDITNQKKIPFKFAALTASRSDKLKTQQVLSKVRKYVTQVFNLGALPNSVSFLNQDDKCTRIILYNIEQLYSARDIFAVVFYANTRPHLTKKFNQDYTRTDWEIAMSQTGSDNILCYVSQELEDGNWFNVVLFTQEAAKHNVMAVEMHKFAAYTLAPKRFNWIRLHNAHLPNGIMASQDIALLKTKYYDFDQNWFAFRVYP